MREDERVGDELMKMNGTVFTSFFFFSTKQKKKIKCRQKGEKKIVTFCQPKIRASYIGGDTFKINCSIFK